MTVYRKITSKILINVKVKYKKEIWRACSAKNWGSDRLAFLCSYDTQHENSWIFDRNLIVALKKVCFMPQKMLERLCTKSDRM